VVWFWDVICSCVAGVCLHHSAEVYNSRSSEPSSPRRG